MDNFTMFTIPRAFKGIHKIRQENAIGSWRRLSSKPEVILFCDDSGVAKAADRLGCIHYPDIARSKFGVPLIGEAFRLAEQISNTELFCYANADIIFLEDFQTALDYCAKAFPVSFLMVGQHWDHEITVPIDFSDPDWSKRLRKDVKEHGKIKRPCGEDYFAFRRGTLDGIKWLPFQVGSPAWDNWITGRAKRKGVNIIEATKAVLCIHHKHERYWPDAGTKYNRGLWSSNGGIPGATTSAQWVMTAKADINRRKP